VIEGLLVIVLSSFFPVFFIFIPFIVLHYFHDIYIFHAISDS